MKVTMCKEVYEPTGHYKVGVTFMDIKDEKRVGVFSEFPEEARRIPLQIFYPTKETEWESAPYCSREDWHVFKDNMSRVEDLAKNPFPFTCLLNAPVYKEEYPYPVILYNPGYGGYIWSNTVLCADLASNGYIVVSMGHPKEMGNVTYDDGSTDPLYMPFQKKLYSPTLPAMFSLIRLMRKKDNYEAHLAGFMKFKKKYAKLAEEHMKIWMNDVRSVQKVLREVVNDHETLLYKAYDPENIGLTGHSFGGALGANMLYSKEGYKCAVNMDGFLFGPCTGKELGAPVLSFCCKENYNLSGLLHEAASKDSTAVIISGMKHNGFTDIKYLIPGAANIVGRTDEKLIRATVTRYHLWFFDTYLKHLNYEITSDSNLITVKKK